jgi:hypothetical protein
MLTKSQGSPPLPNMLRRKATTVTHEERSDTGQLSGAETTGIWSQFPTADHVSIWITQINYLDRCCLPQLYQAGRKKS